MKQLIACSSIAAALVLSGCGSTDSAAPTPRAPDGPAAASSADNPADMPAGPTEESLRVTLLEMYATSRTADFAETYTYFSPRCQSMFTEEEVVSLLTQQSVGRDYSGDPEYTITLTGPVAQVITAAADGQSHLQPQTWTYSDGDWRFDNC